MQSLHSLLAAKRLWVTRGMNSNNTHKNNWFCCSVFPMFLYLFTFFHCLPAKTVHMFIDWFPYNICLFNLNAYLGRLLWHVLFLQSHENVVILLNLTFFVPHRRIFHCKFLHTSKWNENVLYIEIDNKYFVFTYESKNLFHNFYLYFCWKFKIYIALKRLQIFILIFIYYLIASFLTEN